MTVVADVFVLGCQLFLLLISSGGFGAAFVVQGGGFDDQGLGVSLGIGSLILLAAVVGRRVVVAGGWEDASGRCCGSGCSGSGRHVGRVLSDQLKVGVEEGAACRSAASGASGRRRVGQVGGRLLQIGLQPLFT